MKSYCWILPGIIDRLLIAEVAYFQANGVMDSLYAFRSTLQALIVAPVGSMLTGAAALIAKINQRQRSPLPYRERAG